MKNNRHSNGAFGAQLRGKQDINQRRIELLEQERDQLKKEKEWLHQRLSFVLVAVTALGKHANLDPMQARKIVDEYIAAEQVKHLEEQKQKFKDDIAAGKMPEGFKVVDNIDEASKEPPIPFNPNPPTS